MGIRQGQVRGLVVVIVQWDGWSALRLAFGLALDPVGLHDRASGVSFRSVAAIIAGNRAPAPTIATSCAQVAANRTGLGNFSTRSMSGYCGDDAWSRAARAPAIVAGAVVRNSNSATSSACQAEYLAVFAAIHSGESSSSPFGSRERFGGFVRGGAVAHCPQVRFYQ
jgi:hypothetical protein